MFKTVLFDSSPFQSISHTISNENVSRVSKQALSIRMRRLGLLGEEYLKNPNEILDIHLGDNENG